jgi:hypothetical protein
MTIDFRSNLSRADGRRAIFLNLMENIFLLQVQQVGLEEKLPEN